jgi:hypothetical protein
MSSPADVGTCLLPWLLCLEDFYELSSWCLYLFAALAFSAWRTFMSSPAGVCTCLLPWLSLPGGLL